MNPTTTNNKGTSTASGKKDDRVPAARMLEFATLLHQLSGDMIKVYSGQCPCRHSIVSTDTNNVSVQRMY
jgi:hypothetical protein